MLYNRAICRRREIFEHSRFDSYSSKFDTTQAKPSQPNLTHGWTKPMANSVADTLRKTQ